VRDMGDEVTISDLGALGDGIVREGNDELYIPYGIPGDVVSVTRDGSFAQIDKIVSPSTDRVQPQCRHFTRCGGCKLQHVQFEHYLDLKAARVRSAFDREGLDCDIAPVWSAGLGARRRAVFSAARTKKTLPFGFHQYRSDAIENIDECPILVGAIGEHLEDLRRIAGNFLTRKRAAKVGVTASLDGLDVWISGARPEIAPDIVARIFADCERARVQRLIVDGEILYQNGEPEVSLSGVRVPLPSGSFLQACENAEARMAEIIINIMQGRKSLIDLFAGIGTFSFAMAKLAPVLAIENSAKSLAALRVGSDRATGISPVATLNRDLFEDPMSVKELSNFDGLVFDPPRAGALAQAHQIAKSEIAHVVAVSCNPITLARDLKVLVEDGYQIKSVYPIDQFVYSPHVEVVAHLLRT